MIPHHRFRRKSPPWWPEDESWSPHNFRHGPPPWWPENESWPPVEPRWRKMRGRFSRRLGCLMGLFSLLAVGLFFIVMGLLVKGLDLVQTPRPFHWLVPAGIALFVLALAFLVLAGRSLRRYSAPLGDLLDAADRIAEGDYTARVTEGGPREVRSLARAFNGMAERLQVTSEQRRNLLADVTHELRTPLTVIQGNLEGMLDGVYAADEARLKSVLEETQILARLVEDLRVMTLAESGALQLKKESTDLAVLIAETLSVFRAQADLAGVKLTLEAAADLPSLNLDPERMRQVLSNLIGNALRYTPSGGSIGVHICLVPDGQGKRVEITVADTGAGIAPDILPHVFERFFKSRDSSGTGLGLPIAKYLVEAHGGTITAESELGKGTTVRVRLPVDE